MQQVVQAVNRLAEPYRTTILLRYFQELPPHQIAKRLGVPGGTVRSRLKRGIEQLRIELKPAGGGDSFATKLALLAPQAMGVGPPAAPGLATHWLSKILLMNNKLKVTVTMVGLLLAVLVVWKGYPQDKPLSDRIAATGTPSSFDAPESLGEAESAENSEAQVSRTSVEHEEPISEDAPSNIILSGRCVAAESGHPLEGCEIELHGWGTNANDRAMRGAVEWEDPPVQVTGPDGVFHLEFPDLNPFQYAVSIRYPGRVTRRGRWSRDLTADNPRAFGDIPMALGAVIRGRVVSESGEGIPEARISVDGLTGVDLERESDLQSTVGRTDESGAYVLDRSAIPPGTWAVRVSKTGYLGVGPETVTVVPGEAETVVDFKVRSLPYLSGRVQLADGTSISRVGVRAETGISGRTASGRSDDQGEFRVYATQADTTPFPLSIEGNLVEAFETEQTYSWGQRDIVITVQSALSFDLAVVEVDSGAAVEQYAVTCHRVDANSSRYTDKRLGGEHPDGKDTVSGVFRGENVLTVIPWDPALRVSEKRAFTAVEGAMEDHVVEIERMQPLAVRVQRPDKTLVEGASVSVADRPIESPHARLLDPRGGRMSFSGAPPDWPTVLATASTGRDGIAALFFPESVKDGGLLVAVNGETQVFPLVRPLEQDSPIVITLQGAGTVVGVLRHPDVATGNLSISLERVGAPRRGSRRPLEVSKEGEFSAELPVGEYEAYLMIYREVLHHGYGGSSGGFRKLEPPLALFGVKDGEETRLDLETTQFAPGTLTGRVLLDGEALASAEFQFSYRPAVENPRGGGGTSFYTADANGEFTIEDLVPGDYQMLLRVTNEELGMTGSVTSPDIVRVHSGTTASHDFAFRFRTVRVRVLHPDTGEPLALLPCNGAPGLTRGTHTDQDGWVTIWPAPMSTFGFSIFAEDELFVLRDLQAEPDLATTEIEARAARYEQ